MSKTIYNQFSKDLLKLYCSTKHPAIEDALIKFAVLSNPVQNQDLCVWLNLNEKTIAPKFQSPLFLSTLKLLCFLRGKVSRGGSVDKASRSEIVSFFMLNDYMINIPIIYVFESILNTSSVELLAPFSGLIYQLSSIFPRGKENQTLEQEQTTAVLKDLKTLSQVYKGATDIKEHEKYPTIKQQRRDMLVGLLNKFSSEIASAYESHGMVDAARKIKSGILGKLPKYGLNDVLTSVAPDVQLPSLNFEQQTAAEALAKYVFEHYELSWGPDNYRHVKGTCMNKVGAISDEYFRKSKEEQERKRNPLGNIDDDDKTIDVDSEIKMDDNMNPLYMYMLCTFFYFLQFKMKTLG